MQDKQILIAFLHAAANFGALRGNAKLEAVAGEKGDFFFIVFLP